MVLLDTPIADRPIYPLQRPGYGTLGRPCTVNANHFRLDVTIPEEPDKAQEMIDNLNHDMRSTFSLDSTCVGRSFYPSDCERQSIGNGVELWKGFYASIESREMGISMIVDSSVEKFYEPILVSHFVSLYLDRDLSTPLSIHDEIKAKRALKGVEIELTHVKDERKHVICDLSTAPLDQLVFVPKETGETTKVVRYYREKYKIDLKYPSLPALQVGNESNPVYFPMELSKILAGQTYTKKLTEKQGTAFLEKSSDHPKRQISSILEILKNRCAMEGEPHPFTTFTAIDARVLPPPTLQYLDKQVIPQMGVWDITDKKFVKGGKVERWTCLSFSKMPGDALSKFCNDLVKMCTDRGMVFNPEPCVPIRYAPSDNLEEELWSINFRDVIKDASREGAWKYVELIIVILPTVDGSYARIKRICDRDLSVISQCCKPHLVNIYTDKDLANMASNINIKAGGRNFSLKYAIKKSIPAFTTFPTIIFGGHVNHPDPRDHSSSSIAAVVASMDWPDITKYRTSISEQPSRDEVINDLYTSCLSSQGETEGGMVRELLLQFYKSTGCKPFRIIFYRDGDGVSNGQFTQVLQKEIVAIRKACLSFQQNYLPRITYVMVQKGHHTRIFTSQPTDCNTIDEKENILPGTIVESQICHPSEFDFYLCSHAAPHGTIRPAHYHVLQDENFSPDELQSLTNILCYSYAKCTRAISVVAPIEYAYLATSRGRCYVGGESSETESTYSDGGRMAMRRRIEMVNSLPRLVDEVKNRMFFC